MTDYRDPTASDQARDEAHRVADNARHAAEDVAGSAKREARQVAGEATDQIRALYDNALHEAMGHASTQQEKLAGQSRLVSDDLQRISRGERPESDLVNQVLGTVSSRVEKFTTDLETKSPEDLLRDVRRFAARRPGTFLAVAAGVGLVAGRLTRGLRDREDEHEFDGRYRVPSAPGAYGPPATPGAPQQTTTPYPEGPHPIDPDPGSSVDQVPATSGPAVDRLHDTPSRDPFTDVDLPEERR